MIIFERIFPVGLKKLIYHINVFRGIQVKVNDAVIKSFKFFKKKQCLFIHIPKSGGISVYEGLFGCDSFGHPYLREYYDVYGTYAIKKLYKFCVVRNPY